MWNSSFNQEKKRNIYEKGLASIARKCVFVWVSSSWFNLQQRKKQHMKCGPMWIWPTTNNHHQRKKVGLGEFKKTNELVKHFAKLKHYRFELQWKKPTIVNKEFKLRKQQKNNWNNMKKITKNSIKNNKMLYQLHSLKLARACQHIYQVQRESERMKELWQSS